MKNVLNWSVLLWSVTIFFLPSACQVCNERGWFGTKCQYQCHCTNNNCDFTTGKCINNSTCVKGWFGPACQFVDLARKYALPSSVSWLYNEDDNICNDNVTLSTVTVVLSQPTPFTWLRLYVNQHDALNAIELHFNVANSEGGTVVDCNSMRMAAVTETSVDIHCTLNSLIQQVILSGKGVKSLCSLYISGGRNVALRQATSQLSPYSSRSRYNSSHAVDGSIDPFSCPRFPKYYDHNLHWNVTFEFPQAINTFVLHISASQYQRIGFIITSYNERDDQLSQFQVNSTDNSSFRELTTSLSTPVSPAHRCSINIRAYNQLYLYASEILLCEVEIYGDTVCPQGKYGRQCEYSCDNNCINQECFVSTGGCVLGCQDGYRGGTCQTKCQPKHYGKNCQVVCSVQCKDQQCDHVNGTCDSCLPGYTGQFCDQECPHPYYGQDCTETCSTDCVDQRCNKITGICDQCPIGKIGDICGEVCVNGKYGDGCRYNCSDYCNMNVTTDNESPCHYINGACLYGCQQGYEGLLCTNKVSSEDITLALGAGIGLGVTLLLLIIIIVAVVLYRRKTKATRSERQNSTAVYDQTNSARPEEHSYQVMFTPNVNTTQPAEATTSNTTSNVPADKKPEDIENVYENEENDKANVYEEVNSGKLQDEQDKEENVSKPASEESENVYANC